MFDEHLRKYIAFGKSIKPMTSICYDGDSEDYGKNFTQWISGM